MATNKILSIKFQVEDDKFKASIQTLQKSIEQLNQTFSKLAVKAKKVGGSTKKTALDVDILKAKTELLSREMKRLTSGLQQTDINYKKLGVSKKVFKAALQGNAKAAAVLRKALKQANIAQLEFAKGTNITSSALFRMGHSARQTGGAFSVMRSQLLLSSFAMAIFIKPFFDLGKAFSNFEETVNKANVVFGKNISLVRNWAQALGDSVGRAESTILGFASSLQDTFVPLGFTRESAAKLSTAMTKLALDVASFNNKADADVVRDFQSAIVGNHETVKKYGIIINQARVKQEALRLGLVKAKGVMTETAKVQARLSLITKGSTDAMGDLVRTQDEFANKLKKFSEAWVEFAETMGGIVLPILEKILEIFSDTRTMSAYAISVGAVGSAYLFLTGAMISATKASRLFFKTTKIGFLIGLVVGVGELIASFFTLGDSTSKAAEELEELENEISNLEKGIKTVTGTQGKYNLKIRETQEDFKELMAIADEHDKKKLEHAQGTLKNIEDEVNGIKGLIAENETLVKWQEEQAALQDTFARRLRARSQNELKTRKNQIAALKEENEVNKKGQKGYAKTSSIFKELANEISLNEAEIVSLNEGLEELEKLAQEPITWQGLLELEQTLLDLGLSYDVVQKQIQKFQQSVIMQEVKISLKEEIADLNRIAIAKKRGGSLDLQIAVNRAHHQKLEQAIQQQGIEGTEKERELKVEMFELENEHNLLLQEQHQEKIARAFEMTNAVIGIAAAYSNLKLTQLNQAKQQELDATKSIRNDKLRAREVQNIEDEYKEKTKKHKKEMQNVKVAEAISNTALGMTKAHTDPGGLKGWILAAMIGVQGLMNIATIKAQKYQYGGLVGGRRHSSGGTMIEAEQGEFVMTRDATEAIGIENLNRMNLGGGGGGATIVINNPILGKDTIEDEIVPQIKEALRRGGSIS